MQGKLKHVGTINPWMLPSWRFLALLGEYYESNTWLSNLFELEYNYSIMDKDCYVTDEELFDQDHNNSKYKYPL
jgi:hypothetical protein